MSEDKQSSSDAPSQAGAVPPSERPRKRVLIVEDEPRTRLILWEKFRLAGFDVDHATNGSLALEKLRSGHPDAIFMDLLLPYVKGVDVIKEARKDPDFRNRPIYVCTSAALMSVWTRRGEKAGATKVFDKGATPIDEIVAEVAAHLNGVPFKPRVRKPARLEKVELKAPAPSKKEQLKPAPVKKVSKPAATPAAAKPSQPPASKPHTSKPSLFSSMKLPFFKKKTPKQSAAPPSPPPMPAAPGASTQGVSPNLTGIPDLFKTAETKPEEAAPEISASQTKSPGTSFQHKTDTAFSKPRSGTFGTFGSSSP